MSNCRGSKLQLSHEFMIIFSNPSDFGGGGNEFWWWCWRSVLVVLVGGFCCGVEVAQIRKKKGLEEGNMVGVGWGEGLGLGGFWCLWALRDEGEHLKMGR